MHRESGFDAMPRNRLGEQLRGQVLALLCSDHPPYHVATEQVDNNVGMKKYPYRGPMEEASLVSFMNDFFEGRIDAYLKSEMVRMYS